MVGEQPTFRFGTLDDVGDDAAELGEDRPCVRVEATACASIDREDAVGDVVVDEWHAEDRLVAAGQRFLPPRSSLPIFRYPVDRDRGVGFQCTGGWLCGLGEIVG